MEPAETQILSLEVEAVLETMRSEGMVVMLEARGEMVALLEVQSVLELVQAVVEAAVQTHQPRLEQAVVEVAVFMVQQP